MASELYVLILIVTASNLAASNISACRRPYHEFLQLADPNADQRKEVVFNGSLNKHNMEKKRQTQKSLLTELLLFKETNKTFKWTTNQAANIVQGEDVQNKMAWEEMFQFHDMWVPERGKRFV